jgi:hypothetical protein
MIVALPGTDAAKKEGCACQLDQISKDSSEDDLAPVIECAINQDCPPHWCSTISFCSASTATCTL